MASSNVPDTNKEKDLAKQEALISTLGAPGQYSHYFSTTPTEDILSVLPVLRVMAAGGLGVMFFAILLFGNFFFGKFIAFIGALVFIIPGFMSLALGNEVQWRINQFEDREAKVQKALEEEIVAEQVSERLDQRQS